MRIAEIFRSIQGEGFLTGTESVFLRVSGCNLRCGFCDTRYASWEPEGEDLSVEEILGRIYLLNRQNVVLTGGEPMLFSELIPVCQGLRDRRMHITIETAGTLYLPVACDLMSISPKLSNSTPSADDSPKWHRRHEHTRDAPDVVRRLMAEHTYQLKFVIEAPADCDEVERYLARFPEVDRSRVLLMPQGTEPEHLARIAVWLEPYCRKHALTFCPRQQIEWFGAKRGT